MAFDQDTFPPAGNLPPIYTGRHLDNNQINMLAKIKLNNQETLSNFYRLPLVKSYLNDLNWVYRRLLAIGYSNNVAFDGVKGYYTRYLTKFMTPYLTKEVYSRGDVLNNAVTTEALAITAYQSFINTTHNTIYQHPIDQTTLPHPRAHPWTNPDNRKYLMGARSLMLRDRFMYFMNDLKLRLHAQSANLGTRGLIRGGAQIGNLTGIYFSGSDPHHGMQVVLILSFGSTKIVYKPRDTRVDERFMGRQHNVGPHPCAQGSVGDYLNTHGLGNAIPVRGYEVPVYDFLSCGEYGFVQCLEKDFDHYEQKHCERYAWLCGVYAAMAMIFGLTDLHQGNIMLCKKNLTQASDHRTGTRHCLPYLTDLEIAFSGSVLDRLTWRESFDNTGFENAMKMINEVDYIDKFEFERAGTGRLIKGKYGDGVTTNTDNLPRRRGNPMRLVSKPNFRPKFKDGATRVFNILHNLPVLEKDALIQRFNGCRVRYHVQATAAQLTAIRFICGDGREVTQAYEALRPGRNVFLNTLISDLNQFDVAYYIKHLGPPTSGQVDHVRRGIVVTVAGGGTTAASGGDTFQIVRNRLDHLPQGATLNTLLDGILDQVTHL